METTVHFIKSLCARECFGAKCIGERVAPGLVWTENLGLKPMGDPRIVQSVSQSLYRLSYTGPHVVWVKFIICEILILRITHARDSVSTILWSS